LSRLRSMERALTCGSAACCAERLRLSVALVSSPTSSAQAGRLSLPACAEEEVCGGPGRKARGFPHSRRQSRVDHSKSSLTWTGLLYDHRLLLQWFPALPSCVRAGAEHRYSKLTHYLDNRFIDWPWVLC